MVESINNESMLVTMIGFDQRDYNAFDMILQRPDVKPCTLANAEQAQLVIVDLDKYGAADEWAALQQAKPGQLALLMSVNEALEQPGQFFVKKPARVKEITTGLEAARKKLFSKQNPASKSSQKSVWKRIFASRSSEEILKGIEEEGGSDEIGPVDPDKSQGESFSDAESTADPSTERLADKLFPIKGYLLDEVKQAVQESKTEGIALRLQLGNQGTIIIDPAEHWIITDFIPALLQELCSWSLDDVEINKRECSEKSGLYLKDSHENKITPVDVDVFLWDLALWTYQGRLPVDMDLEKKVMLKGWPDLTRLTLVPDAMRMASLWLSVPMTISDTIEVLKIKEENVCSFYSAVHTLDLVRQNIEEHYAGKGKSADNGPSRRQRSQFFMRILNHINGRNIDDK